MGNAATREERRERREPSAPAHSCSALMLGLDNAGKSAVLARLCGEEVRTLLPTRVWYEDPSRDISPPPRPCGWSG